MNEPTAHDSRISRISTIRDLTPQGLVQRYGRAVRSYLKALLRDEDDVDDAAQNFHVKVMRGDLNSWLPEKGRFRDFFKTAVRNTALDHLRKKQGRGRQVDDLSQLAEEDTPGSSGQRVWFDIWRRTLLDATLSELKAFQDEHPGNVYFTLIGLLGETAGDVDSKELAAALAKATGRSFTPAHARKQKQLAREKFAELLFEEVKRTLPDPGPDQVQEELAHLGVLDRVRHLLPAEKQTGGAPEDGAGD